MWRLASLKLSTSNLVSGEIYTSLSGAWPGAQLPPAPDSKLVPGKGTPDVSLQILPSCRKGQRPS